MALEPCIFCWRDTRNRVQLMAIPGWKFTICERCTQDLRVGKKTAEDVRDRLAELKDMGMLT